MSEYANYDSGVVHDRRMTFCPTLQSKFGPDASNLYHVCTHCDVFLCVCCQHSESRGRPPTCHHFPVVFVDGACPGNGTENAVAGIGGLFGNTPEAQWSIPVDNSLDPTPIRTNQRAELLAAIEGIRRLGYCLESRERTPDHKNKRLEMVVATDSDYVCKGVIEWMPKWKINGWRSSSGKPVVNKDLFVALDEAICVLERRDIDVSFWWINRRFNTRADVLAKAACYK